MTVHNDFSLLHLVLTYKSSHISNNTQNKLQNLDLLHGMDPLMDPTGSWILLWEPLSCFIWFQTFCHHTKWTTYKIKRALTYHILSLFICGHGFTWLKRWKKPREINKWLTRDLNFKNKTFISFLVWQWIR